MQRFFIAAICFSISLRDSKSLAGNKCNTIDFLGEIKTQFLARKYLIRGFARPVTTVDKMIRRVRWKKTLRDYENFSPCFSKIVSARHGNVRLISPSDLNEFRESSKPQIFVDSSTSCALIGADDGVGVDKFMVGEQCWVLNMKTLLSVLCERCLHWCFRFITPFEASQSESLSRIILLWRRFSCVKTSTIYVETNRLHLLSSPQWKNQGEEKLLWELRVGEIRVSLFVVGTFLPERSARTV